jgi:hypothetical protein
VSRELNFLGITRKRGGSSKEPDCASRLPRLNILSTFETLRSVKGPWEGELFPDAATVKKMIYRMLRAPELKGKSNG